MIVQKIILCGHYDCGGVKAALRNHDHGIIEQWIMGIRDVARYHRKVLVLYTNHTVYCTIQHSFDTVMLHEVALVCMFQYTSHEQW